MDYQREIITKAFNVKPYEHYGLSEGVVNISQHKNGTYSVDQDFAFTEFIPIDDEKRFCRIIGTNYSNLSFPLIRYDTGDIAEVEWLDGKPRVVRVEGRMDDFITLGNGNKFGPMNQIFKNFQNVKEAQIYYPSTNSINVRIVKGEKFDLKTDEGVIIKSIKERLTDNKASILIQYVDQVERTRSGKIKSVIKN
jgi:phenylacetate-CoA ligase